MTEVLVLVPQEARWRSMVKIVNGEIIQDDAGSGPQSTPLPNPWSTARPAGTFTAYSASSLHCDAS